MVGVFSGEGRMSFVIRYAIPAITALLSFTSTGHGETDPECSCSPWPFTPDPPCFNICAVNLARDLTPNELSNALGTNSYSGLKAALDAIATTGTDLSPEVEIKLRDAFENADKNRLNETLSEWNHGSSDSNIEMQLQAPEIYKFPNKDLTPQVAPD